MSKTMIVGLDLSLSCTGITIAMFDNECNAKVIQFHRVLFDNQTSKKGKIYKPDKVQNINDTIYLMPTNISVNDIVMDETDQNNTEQCEATLQSMICSKKIIQILANAIKKYEPTEFIFSFENFIMPTYSGKAQLKVVSKLIMLQGFVRAGLVNICLSLSLPFKLSTPTAGQNKLRFTNNGVAEKVLMCKFFFDKYEGTKLIPGASIVDVGKINDVVDSFALMYYAWYKWMKKIPQTEIESL